MGNLNKIEREAKQLRKRYQAKFGELSRILSEKIKAIAFKLDGKYTVLSHDDLYQEAMIYLWEKLLYGELEEKTESFVLQGCYFQMKNYIRKNHRKTDANSVSLNKYINDDDDTLEEILPDKDGTKLENLERNLFLKNFAETLEERENRILTLLADGFTTREIGKKLGISHVRVVKIKKVIVEKAKHYQNR